MAWEHKDKDGLTRRQRAYVNARMAGKGLAESYKEAGYSARQTERSMSQNACHLEQMEHIRVHMERLRAISELNALDSIEDRRAALIEIYQTSTNDKDRLKALDLLSRTYGDYIDRKEISAAVGISRDDRADAMRETLECLKKAWDGTDVEE